jgi:exodeoxyribonuclease-5
MELKSQQLEALEQMRKWFKGDKKRPFILQGYAGTGKTTLVKTCLTELGSEYPALIAPTGRAARVLTAKTGQEATTVHKFRYKPLEDERKKIRKRLGELYAELGNSEVTEEIKLLEKEMSKLEHQEVQFTTKDDQHCDLILVDEASMVSEKMGWDIDNLYFPVIYVGDSFQLPPVKAKAYWDNKNPNYILTDIVRQQGEGLGIARAGANLRIGKQLEKDSGFEIIRKGIMKWDDYLKYDIILCGTNNMRRAINRKLRAMLGHEGDIPVPGEKIMCLANNDVFDISNGDNFIVKEIKKNYQKIISIDIQDPFGKVFTDIPCWKGAFLDDSNLQDAPFGLGMFTFAYCITVHKSQGSEWQSVLLLDDWPRDDKARWIYTGITRASLKCTVISDTL